MLSQNRLIVFGRETAEKGIYSHLDYFVRNADNRATVLVAVSDTTAEDLVSAKMGESILTANSIEDILKAMQFNTNIINQELYKLINKLECPCSNAFLPVLKAEQEGGGEKADIRFVNVAVFDEDQILFEMENEAVTALMMLHNQVEHGYFSVQNQDFSAETVVKIRHCSVKVKPQSTDGGVHFTVRVNMEVDIAEIQTETPFSISEAYLNETQRLCHEYQLTRNLSIEEIKKSGFDTYFVDHTTGVYPVAASGAPFTAAYLQSKGDVITDLHEDLAAEQKARTTYDNILRLVDDPDVREPIKFLREREIVHYQRFGEGLRLATDKLNEKNFYAFNPSFDKKCNCKH